MIIEWKEGVEFGPWPGRKGVLEVLHNSETHSLWWHGPNDTVWHEYRVGHTVHIEREDKHIVLPKGKNPNDMTFKWKEGVVYGPSDTDRAVSYDPKTHRAWYWGTNTEDWYRIVPCRQSLPPSIHCVILPIAQAPVDPPRVIPDGWYRLGDRKPDVGQLCWVDGLGEPHRWTGAVWYFRNDETDATPDDLWAPCVRPDC